MTLEQLEFADALKDSPRFRYSLAQHETYLVSTESKIKDVLRHCCQAIEFGKSYVNSFQLMLDSVKDLNVTSFRHDSDVFNSVEIVVDAFSEINKIQRNLIEQAQTSVVRKLNELIKQDLSKVTEMRTHFQRVSQSLDDALVRNAQIGKHKEQDGFEARNELTAVGTCFAHTALDYVFQVNLFQSQEKFKLLEACGGFLSACQTYFRQGCDLLGDDAKFENTKFDLMPVISVLQQQSKTVERKMQDRHMLVPKEIFQHPPGMPTDADVVMEGYLFKRCSNAFKTWNRRWFLIRDSKLLYCHRDMETSHPSDKSTTTDDGYTVMESDLRLCLVRSAPNADRRYCFELVTPSKIHTLQADSESLCNAWIKALQRSIESALHDSSEHALMNDSYRQMATAPASNNSSPSTKSRKIVDYLSAIVGNESCADCSAPDPKWASVNLGITLCIECCAIHRSLGVQISKIRSLTLDAWEPEQIKLMEMLGNKIVNAVYLANLPDLSVPPPAKENSSRPVRDAWIKAKYLHRTFVRPVKILNDSSAADGIKPRTPKKDLSLVTKRKLFPVPAVLQVDYRARKFRAMSTTGDVRMLPKPVRLVGMKHFASSPSIPQQLAAAANGSVKNFEDEERRPSLLSSYGSESVLDKSQEIVQEADEEAADMLAQNQLLLRASREADLKLICLALAKGACVNYSCREHDNLTSLHEAVISGSLEACEYLLLNGAKVNVQDIEGRSPLHLACRLGHTAQVCQLLKRGANQDMCTVSGETALEIAMDAANADIVTLLRLAKLNEEIKETDITNAGDETFAEVVRDFSNIASNRPEILKRNNTDTGAGALP